MRAPVLLLLALVPLVAGCASDAEDDHPDAPTPRAEDATACSPFEETLLEWTSSENPADHEFEVAQGTATLDVQWTPPTAAVRPYSATIVDPDDAEVFARVQGEGATAGPSSVAIGDSRSTNKIETPPPVGTYRFRFVSEGTVEGGALRIVAAGCA